MNQKFYNNTFIPRTFNQKDTALSIFHTLPQFNLTINGKTDFIRIGIILRNDFSTTTCIQANQQPIIIGISLRKTTQAVHTVCRGKDLDVQLPGQRKDHLPQLLLHTEMETIIYFVEIDGTTGGAIQKRKYDGQYTIDTIAHGCQSDTLGMGAYHHKRDAVLGSGIGFQIINFPNLWFNDP